MVEGVFSRAFRSGLRPVELGRRMVREMDLHRSVGVRGRTVAPNDFTFRLSPEDLESLGEISVGLERELTDLAREHAREAGDRFLGPLRIEFVPEQRFRAGTFDVTGRMRESDHAAGTLVLPNDDRLSIGQDVVTIGRMPECSIQLSDPNVSRNHAEVRPSGSGFVFVDLGSTNGSRVNGSRVSQHDLVDGDEITVGNTRISFYAS